MTKSLETINYIINAVRNNKNMKYICEAYNTCYNTVTKIKCLYNDNICSGQRVTSLNKGYTIHPNDKKSQ